MRLVPSTCGNLNADELAGVIHRLSHDDPSVTSLTMSWSNLGDDGCEKLSDSLRFNNYLVDLDIYSNNISSAGLIRMGLALECVQVLAAASRIESNLLDDPPTPTPPRSFNTTLRSINLEWNPIGETGASILLNSLRMGNTSLTELNIGSCGVSLATQRCLRPPCPAFALSSLFFTHRVLLAKVEENRTSMLSRSTKAWLPGSIEPKPPAPPVKPAWQVGAAHVPALPSSAFSQFRNSLTLFLQPIPIIRKTETVDRDGVAVPRTHKGPPNLGSRFLHAYLADPLHDTHVKPPSLPKPSNRFAPDLAR